MGVGQGKKECQATICKQHGDFPYPLNAVLFCSKLIGAEQG